MSYDVNKDGVKVAVLTFTKAAYRLGETILGVVELNARASRARVLKVCATNNATTTVIRYILFADFGYPGSSRVPSYNALLATAQCLETESKSPCRVLFLVHGLYPTDDFFVGHTA